MVNPIVFALTALLQTGEHLKGDMVESCIVLHAHRGMVHIVWTAIRTLGAPQLELIAADHMMKSTKAVSNAPLPKKLSKICNTDNKVIPRLYKEKVGGNKLFFPKHSGSKGTRVLSTVLSSHVSGPTLCSA